MTHGWCDHLGAFHRPNSFIINRMFTFASQATRYPCCSILRTIRRDTTACDASSSTNASMRIYCSGRFLKALGFAALAFPLLISASCGGGSSPSPGSGPLSGNWQVNLLQVYPAPEKNLSVSGFLIESSTALAGSVQGPTIINQGGILNCGGTGLVSGSVSGQNVTFSVNPGGTVFNFTGVISSDNMSMSGSYVAQGGACFTTPTSGTFTASLIPPLNGSFTGTFSNSQYMGAYTGQSIPPPIVVSGTLTQTPNVGANNASVTGTITTTGYPCFATAVLTGTISGDTVLLNVFGYNGDLIGSIGSGSPAIVANGTSGVSLTTGQGGLQLGLTSGPCPTIETMSGVPTSTDTASVTLTLQ